MAVVHTRAQRTRGFMAERLLKRSFIILTDAVVCRYALQESPNLSDDEHESSRENWKPESNIGTPRYEGGVYPIAPFLLRCVL